MGGFCSKGSAVDKSPSDTTLGPDRVIHERGGVKEERKTVAVEEAAAKRTHEQQQPQQHQQQPPQRQQVQQQHLPVLEATPPGVSGGAGAAPWDGVPSLARQQSQKSGMGAKASALPTSLVLSYFALNVCNAAEFITRRLFR
jgi:hypothetical protein